MRKQCEQIPTEHMEQRTLVEWARMQGRNVGRYPGLALTFAIPNGGGRTTAEAGMLYAEGVLKGVPDLFVPWPKIQHAGLFIEMKRMKGAKVSQEQRDMILQLRDLGYAAEVCYGADEAMSVIRDYYAGETRLSGRDTRIAELEAALQNIHEHADLCIKGCVDVGPDMHYIRDVAAAQLGGE